MTALPFVGIRPRATRALRRLPAAEASERRLKRRVGLIWGLLVLNVLSFSTGVSVIPIPGSVGKVITQGALTLAVLLALMQNPRGKFRPNVFLLLVTLLALETVVTVLTVGYAKGTYYRTFRTLEFVAVLWLLSPYWNRADMLMVRCHMKAMLWVVITVVIGIIIDPTRALNGGRLQDIIRPIVSTQVAHYAAVSIGIAAIMWFCGQLRGKIALWYVLIATVVLLLTHTRTALVAMFVALLVSGLSLIATSPRVRRLFAVVAAVTVVAFAAFSSAITSWMARGEGTAQLTNLTGRTNFWGPLLAYPRTTFQEIFGFGLSNGSFAGLPIDSNWMLSYQDQGLFGVVMCAVILLYVLILACLQSRGMRRALALFLVIYCIVASFTEDGITNPSTYMLDVTVAASLLLPAATRRQA
jgi:hypothetical protein